MTTYLCRDYPQVFNTVYQGDVAQFLLAVFLKNVCGYTVVGSTNFSMTALASGTASPNLAGINYGATGSSSGGSAYFEVGIPSGVYTVSAADVQRVLVLKSTANPTFNAGCFSVIGVDVTNNRFIVDYRTSTPGSVSFPPVETGGAAGMEWWLYNQETTFPSTRGANTGTGYRGYTGAGVGSSSNSRIILQSPHSTAWQVRLNCENSTDYSTNHTCTATSISPGFGGNSAGDFPNGANGGQHLHQPLFWDELNSNQGADYTRAWAMGPCSATSGTLTGWLSRITIVADDGGQACAVFVRHLNSGSNPTPGWSVFGICDNEPTPLPTNNTQRLFVLGNTAWQSGACIGFFCTVQGNQGMQGNGFSSLGVPVSAAPGQWAYATGNSQNGSPITDGNATDNPFMAATELNAVDVWAGTTSNWSQSGLFTYGYPFEPSLLGTIPFVRAGRTNFNTYQATSDASLAWYHFINGVFMTYNGPAPTP